MNISELARVCGVSGPIMYKHLALLQQMYTALPIDGYVSDKNSMLKLFVAWIRRFLIGQTS